MQLLEGSVVVSATDLVGYLACDHLVTLELEAAAGRIERPIRHDPELELIQRRGFEHEAAHLAALRDEGRSVHEIETRDAKTADELRAAEAETFAAMRAGRDVIFQATFFDGRWRGHADFLLRVERPSALGDWSYEVADTKLARRVKAAALLQMCVYADRLEQLQGVAPETMYVVTGDGVRHPYRVADYSAYYRRIKASFEARVFGDRPAPVTYPEPVDHCRVCRWYGLCADRRRFDDHLSLVAGITRVQRSHLVDAELPTRRALGASMPGSPVPDIGQPALEKIRSQARIQLEGEAAGHVLSELIAPEPPDPEASGPSRRGLALLPEPSSGDLFFDIESDPWALESGLEYLFGAVEEVAGAANFTALWGHDRAGEKAMFEAFIDRVIGRLDADPNMHVYHYAPYEPVAIKRLMGRHATREDEVDRLLRGGVFVDLYRVVRQGVRVSTESYSIKQVEKLYMPVREGPVTDAGFSVIAYERWMERPDQAILDGIEAYNRDDCISTWMLRGWLEQQRAKAQLVYPDADWSRPPVVDGAPTEEIATTQAETAERARRLTEDVPADATERTEEQQARWLLAGLLDWHRREAKPQWWAWFTLRDASPDELYASPDALAGLEFVADRETIKQSLVTRYRFDPLQEYKLKVGDEPIDPATGKAAGSVQGIDPAAGTIDLLRGRSRQGTHPAALIPSQPYDTKLQREALGKVADRVLAAGIEGPGPYRAVRELLLRRPPRIVGLPEGARIAGHGDDIVAVARRIGLALDQTVLPIQGPPGSGKTYTGARMIVELVAAGKRVGITATAHKAITNLVDAAVAAAAVEGADLDVIQKGTIDSGSRAPGVRLTGEAGDVAPALVAGTHRVAAGTSWLFARPDMAGALDVLFVDEAGQLSLADVVAVGGSARSIVLLGDPNQLPQVSQGSHPDGAEASALEHLLGEAQTVPEDRGLFLPTTRRLHPDICDFISEAFYEGRLQPHPETARQGVGPGGFVEGTGIRFVPVAHDGNQARSREEADLVAEAIRGLVGRRWTDQRGVTRDLGIDDVLVVAPYNAQVAEIVRRVGTEFGRPRVGTVDKFQGQEAPVAIYSMATSTPEDAPRQMEFLYSGNRLNVAISRAQGVAILVCSPALLRVRCHTPAQMRLANALCRYVEMAAEAESAREPVEAAADTAPRREVLTLGL
ncbi:MAG TPA: TM0106 family RecB-like putative nuclease [Candidatus Limnocylindrales bacterium]|nr:TM0106 family RecB-like putative nuclease [Candidatus Limnocylindrales bacterium]